jgi:hypothetical protein
LLALEQRDGGIAVALDGGQDLSPCKNDEQYVCNWLVEDGQEFCVSCRHNRTVPDLTIAENLPRWAKIEQAKRHLFYSLLNWRLPMPTRAEDENEGLAFDFIGDVETLNGVQMVMTGHANGIITLNIAEADDPEREARRVALGEPYRTLLGHLRHEIGHYYWDRLVRDGGAIEGFRAIFGDETADYGQALLRHHQYGPQPGWQGFFISAYASSHPWEDFAETWAHYMHIVDTLETASAFGVAVDPKNVSDPALSIAIDFDPYRRGSIDDLIKAWAPVTVLLNSLDRSLGQPDVYPFVLTQQVIEKLGFIHALVRAAAQKNETGLQPAPFCC